MLQPRTEPGRRFTDVAESHVEKFAARAEAHDRAGNFPSENFAELAVSGALGAFVPESLGGLGLDSVRDWAVGLSRLGRADASTAIALNMHLGASRMLVGAWRGAVAGGDEAGAARSEALLKAIASGNFVICATATEAGTDFLRPKTTATRVSDGWRLDGRKIFATLSPIANLYVMNLRVPSEEGDQMGFAFVPADTPGLVPQDDWDALGMRASGSQSVVLDGCVIPDGTIQIAGPWGSWTPPVLMGRTLANLTLLGAFVGVAEAARQLAIDAAQQQSKPKFGGPIAGHSGVQHLVGEIEIDFAAASAILVDTANELDAFLEHQGSRTPSLDDAHECMKQFQCAKWIVNEKTIAVVSKAMDVVGGGAYLSAHPLSRLYRDVRAAPFMQPFAPNEAREYIGQVALGRLPDG